MDAPSSTPFPISTFQNGPPVDLLQFLRNLLSSELSDDNSENRQFDKKTWLEVIAGLSDHLLTGFPSSSRGGWEVLREVTTLTDTTLEVIRRVLHNVEGLFAGTNGFAEKLFTRLLNLCCALDARDDPEVVPEGDSPSAKQLRAKAFLVTFQLLRYLGGIVGVGKQDEDSGWILLRKIIVELLAVSDDLSSAQALAFPMSVCLFRTPRIRDLDVKDAEVGKVTQTSTPLAPSEGPINISLARPCNAYDFQFIVVDLLINAISPPVHSQLFLQDLVPRIGTSLSSAFYAYCLGQWSVLPFKRAQYLSKSLTLAKRLHTVHPTNSLNDTYGDMASRLLLCRLKETSPVCRLAMDDTLVQCLRSDTSLILSKANSLLVLAAVSALDPEDLKGLQLSLLYLSKALPWLDTATLRTIKTAFSHVDIGETALDLVEAIDTQLAILAVEHDQNEDRMDVDAPVSTAHTWRGRACITLQGIPILDQDRAALENAANDDQFVQHAFICLSPVLNESLQDLQAEQRVIIADHLRDLLCLLVHHDDSPCVRSTHRDTPFLPVYLAIVDQLLMGTDTQVPNAVRKACFDVLASGMRHQPIEENDTDLDNIAGMLCRTMSDRQRSIRLSAGRALVELIRFYHFIGKPAWPKVDPIFDVFYGLLDVGKDPVKETVLITVGEVGRVTNADVLGVALSCLISQLGKSSPVVKGVAYMQLLSLAKHHKKTSYGLVLPYMDKVAPYLLSRWHSQPMLLLECCRFISMPPTDYISSTLPRTLPQLFANCEQKALEKISKELQVKLSTLFLNRSHDILAYVFLLDNDVSTNKAISFTLRILSQAADNAEIRIHSVIKSCVVPLLAKLVNALGDEDENKVTAARNALRKVEMYAHDPEEIAQNPLDLGSFLKVHMLGIISYMSEMLQEIKAKATLSFKKQILRSLGALVSIIGPSINAVSPQILAILQVTLTIPELADVTLDTWHKFLTTLSHADIGPHAGVTSACIISSWPNLSEYSQLLARRSLLHMLGKGSKPSQYLDQIADPFSIPELHDIRKRLWDLRVTWKEPDRLRTILDRASNDNSTVAVQALRELKLLMTESPHHFQNLASGDNFSPVVGHILVVLFACARRESDHIDSLRLLAFECIGALGAVDPDRFDFKPPDSQMIVMQNFTDEDESINFALHLICDVLVGAFRSARDTAYQTTLAYTIQEMMRFCGFNSALISPRGSIPIKVRSRWGNLKKEVHETITPLLDARYKVLDGQLPLWTFPLYPTQSTYREWIQLWATYLITRASDEGMARSIFYVFRTIVRNKDVGVARHLLPHLVLHVLISGDENDAGLIRMELLAVLEDQVDPESTSTVDKRLLSTQATFVLMDHLNKWVRLMRRDLARRGGRGNKRHPSAEEEALLRVDSVLSNIDQELMAKAAFQSNAYARSLMGFERHIGSLRERNAKPAEVQRCYERLHEIYANLDEPDSMEGVSTLILSPTLEHQIRQHESTGRWTSAQSCWELRLQQNPDNLDHHIGLLRCLRNLGHYDTLRTHVKGVLTRNPEWRSALADFQVESAWIIGDWNEVDTLAIDSSVPTASMVMARLLLAFRSGDAAAIQDAQREARMTLGSPISAAGAREYRHAYNAVLNLHLVHEVEMIHQAVQTLPPSARQRNNILSSLAHNLTARLELSLPTFRIREPILSMRRTAFSLRNRPLTGEIGRSWLLSAKIARKAGHWQTAYSAMLHAQESHTALSFVQTAKLIKANGEPLRALQELDNSMRAKGYGDDAQADVIDLTEDSDETKIIKAKAQVVRARWMDESERYSEGEVLKEFVKATEIWPKWETGPFYYGRFQDDCYKKLSAREKSQRGIKMCLQTVRSYTKAMKYGSKYIYQTVPRLLTLWLDLGEDELIAKTDTFTKINLEVKRVCDSVPAYKWYTAFPQLASRVGHENREVYPILAKIINFVLKEYPSQALWLFASVMKSTKSVREKRAKDILNNLRRESRDLATLIDQCMCMANALLSLCDFPVGDTKKTLSMKKDFPGLLSLAPSKLIIPLQESLIASLPPTSSASDSEHQPFPLDAPTIARFFDEIEIMRSLAKPRKIKIAGSNGLDYSFLGKPKDDLRKDARLMDFNSIINKLLKANSDSRRRQLHIRTYGVVTLNEECGFIQWVPHTVPIRPVLLKLYDARCVRGWDNSMLAVFNRLKEASEKETAIIFETEILPQFPSVFHDWFTETFPEPSVWLASRLTYSRTVAVMSMVGFILGLGDRHLENILLDENTGDAIHVDFNCLFEKGKTLDIPERVPFRLTHNMVDGLGVAGVEGVFRLACENTLQLLRDNRDTLMSVLDAFIHDPLVEWEDEKRKLDRQAERRQPRNAKARAADANSNAVKDSTDLRSLAKNALHPIEKKLKGLYSTSKERAEKEISTSNLVQMLIQEATSPANLGKMYAGWAPYH